MVMPLGNEAKPRITPWVTYLLIGINLACFGVELLRPLSFLDRLRRDPLRVDPRDRHPPPLRLSDANPMRG